MKTSERISVLALLMLLPVSCNSYSIEEPGKLVPKTVDQEPSLPSITVNGAMLHAEAFGSPDSTMVVCIHGGPGADYRGLLNCKDLADYGYRVVLYDQRGSGLSQRFSEKSYTDLGLGVLDLLYDELSGVIDHYRTNPAQKVFLLGHSWGGILAAAYAGKYPNAIQGLIVAEPGGLIWDDITTYVEESLTIDFLSEVTNDATYRDQFITGKEDDHVILDYKRAMLASRNETTGENNIDNPASFWRLGAVINAALTEVGNDYEPDFNEGISNFNVPVAFFYSAENEAYTDSWAQKISSAYNSVALFKITGTGHNGIISDESAWREQTLPQLLEYCKSL